MDGLIDWLVMHPEAFVVFWIVLITGLGITLWKALSWEPPQQNPEPDQGYVQSLLEATDHLV